MTEDLPKAVWEGKLHLCGIPIRVYNLDDGQRILNADDVHRLVAALQGGATMTDADAEAFARVLANIDKEGENGR